MRKAYLITAIALLLSVCAFAQNTPSADNQYPSAAPSQQQPNAPSQPDTSKASTEPASSERSKTVEGCIAGAAGNYTLTDSKGKTWPLTGDTSGLANHVGHTVKVSGSQDPQGSFNVKKVKMVSGTCQK
ncbi:MAG TPA: hypothetical protein VKE93_16400 [Candidatus Angelobacter sp.]|nr:hypothetical protein [Candidatus Angelobacter sp.]